MSKKYQAHFSAELPSNISPNPSIVISEAFENTPLCPPKKSIVRVPDFWRVWNPHIFVTLGLMPSFGTLCQFLNLPPLSPQLCDSAGGRGVQDSFFYWNPNIFVC